MTQTRAIVLVAVGAMLIQAGGTFGLMALGVKAGTALTLPTLVAVVVAGLAVGEVVTRYGRKADRQT